MKFAAMVAEEYVLIVWFGPTNRTISAPRKPWLNTALKKNEKALNNNQPFCVGNAKMNR